MDAKLVCLLLAIQINLLLASDYHVVPTLNPPTINERPRPQPNHDRVVPQINISPLGVHHDSVISDSGDDLRRYEKYPRIFDSDEDIKIKEEYPTPRSRIQELEEKPDSKTSIPTPRPRIFDSDESLDKSISSSEKEGKTIVRDDPKPFDTVHHSLPKEVELPDSNESIENAAKGQPEVILVIQDVESEEEKPKTAAKDAKQDDVSTEEIARYIDEIDQAYKGKVSPYSNVQDKLVDPALGLHKYIVKDSNLDRPIPNRLRREAPKESKSSAASQSTSNDKIPAVDGEKISNVHQTSGGVSYNVRFDSEKVAKLPLNTRTKREGARPMAVSDVEKTEELPKVTAVKDHPWFKAVSLSSEDSSNSDSHSSELTHPDPDLDSPADENNTFSEILHKVTKSHQQPKEQENSNNSSVYTQEVSHIPHKGPTIKNSSVGESVPAPFLAVDPPASNEGESDDNDTIAIIVVEKTIVVENDEQDQNKTQNVFIENADINVNVISDMDDEDEATFWQNGLTVDFHISPLVLILSTVLILFGLLMRLALKMYKKRLEASMAPPYENTQKKSAQFDNVSLQTVSTA